MMWLHPNDCDAPHSVSRLNQVVDLANDMERRGWDGPNLIGYPLAGRIQLLSGTHRHAAATLRRAAIPVEIVLRSDIERCWGTEQWALVMAVGEPKGEPE